MKKRIFKRMMAIAMATAMLCSTMVVSAASTDETGNITGKGELEGYVDKKVYSVELPTVTTVDFTIDPQGLLGIADSTNYTLGAGAVYFTNDGGESADTYSGTSDEVKVGNLSSYALDVTATVTVTLPENCGFTMAESLDALDTATTPMLWLGLIAGAEDAVTLAAGDTAIAKQQVAAVPEVNGDTVTAGYKVKVEGDAGAYTYSYALTDGYEAENFATFKLTGKCDTTADWGDVTETAMTDVVKIVWSATEHVNSAAPSIATTTYTLAAGTAVDIAYDLGVGAEAATDVAKVEYYHPSNEAYVTLTKDTDYTVADGKVTFTAARADKTIGHLTSASKTSTKLKITFNDSVPTAIEVTLNAPSGD